MTETKSKPLCRSFSLVTRSQVRAMLSSLKKSSSLFLFQLFSVLFFLMMSVLGVGSAVALLSSVNTVLLDAFPRVRTVYMSALSCTVGFGIGLIYCTPVSN